MDFFFLHSSKLIQSQLILLQKMKKDNDKAKAPFRPTPMWKEIGRQIEKEFHKIGIEIAEQQIYNTMFSQSLPSNKRYFRYALWMLYKIVKKKDKFELLKKVPSTIGIDSGLAYEFEGIVVNWDLLISIDNLYSIYEIDKRIFTKPLIFVDLGSGWGRLGYVLKSINKKCVYIALDLPEALLICITRLSKLFSKQKILSYEKLQTQRSWTKDQLLSYDLAFGGPQDLERCMNKSIDVLVNIGSFQEMTQPQVNAYLKLINRKLKGVFYTSQYWQPPRIAKKYDAIEGYNSYRFPVTWKRKYLRNISYSERYFETGYTAY